MEKWNIFRMSESTDRATARPYVDENEAPEGYKAVPKSATNGSIQGYNICRDCDYRPTCQTISVNNCADYARKDNVSVVFKRKEIN